MIRFLKTEFLMSVTTLLIAGTFVKKYQRSKKKSNSVSLKKIALKKILIKIEIN